MPNCFAMRTVFVSACAIETANTSPIKAALIFPVQEAAILIVSSNRSELVLLAAPNPSVTLTKVSTKHPLTPCLGWSETLTAFLGQPLLGGNSTGTLAGESRSGGQFTKRSA